MKLQKPADLARLVKNARVGRNLTQQDVADAAGITRQSLARIERGNGGASFDTVILILDRLGIQLEAIPINAVANAAHVASVPDAAQTAAAELAKRITPPISSGPLKEVQARVDAAALASLRDAAKHLSARIVVPGSVALNVPRAVDAPAEPAADDDDATKGAE